VLLIWNSIYCRLSDSRERSPILEQIKTIENGIERSIIIKGDTIRRYIGYNNDAN
jgi:hypothetical protein